MRILKAVILLGLLAIATQAQTTSKDLIFSTTDPTQCSSSKLYINRDSAQKTIWTNIAGICQIIGGGGAGAGANVSLSNLTSVAINSSLTPSVSGSVSLGSTTKMWGSAFLAASGVINFNNGDVTITHSTDTLTLAGGTLILPNAGLKLLDTNASHSLIVSPGSDLTANRTLTLTTGDADRTLTIGASASVAGSNTGDQTITLTGNVTGTGSGSFATTIANNVVTGAMIALGSDAQGDIMYYSGTDWVRLAAGTNGHFLKTQGGAANPLWAAVTATAAGSDTQLQYNNATALGAITGATSNGTSLTVSSGNLLATRPKITTSIDDANGNEVIKTPATTSAVNEITVTNSATGNAVSVAATGGDTDISLTLAPKGVGVLNLGDTAGTTSYLELLASGAPSTPSSGVGSVYVDNTSKNISVKDDAGVVKHGVQTVSCTNQVVTAISDAGAGTCASITNAMITASTIDLTTKVTGILPSANGGTANAFFTVAGPTSTAKTYTVPNANTTLSFLVANGTSALGTSAISSGACASVVTTSATGTATTDVIWWGFNGDPTSTTGYQASANGMLTVVGYPSADNVNWKVCNNTSSSVTPGAITLNWRVIR